MDRVYFHIPKIFLNFELAFQSGELNNFVNFSDTQEFKVSF